MFSAQNVKELRDKTGAGMLDCKKALEASNGDMENAITWLREKGISKAQKKAERIAAEGISEAISIDNVASIVEVNCETDFVAKSDAFQALVKDIAMHIAAAKPEYVTSAEVPTEVLEKEKEILIAQAKNEGKPDNIIEKMVEGRIKKYYKDVCLMDQEFVKNPDLTIAGLVNEAVLQIGEKISVRRFVRYEMGEGLEKRNDNLAEEVAKLQANN